MHIYSQLGTLNKYRQHMNQTMHELDSKYRAINMNGIKDIQELKHHISQHSPLMLASFMCRSKLSFKNSILGLS